MAGSFEAKKIAWRQTAKDGIVLALSIHPDDMPKEMAGSALNTRYMIAFAEIGDDEKPVKELESDVERHRRSKLAVDGVNEGPPITPIIQAEGGPHKKAWSDYTRSQQAAILCRDPAFQRYFVARDEADTASKLREHFRIGSRKDFDDPARWASWDEFVALYNLHRDRLK